MFLCCHNALDPFFSIHDHYEVNGAKNKGTKFWHNFGMIAVQMRIASTTSF